MAVVILAMAITTALAAMQRAFLELDTARSLQAAGNIMQCEFEKERLFPWAQLNDAAYQASIDSTFLRNPAIAGRFALTRSVATIAQRSGQVVQVTLTVTWRSYTGRNLTRSYTTYFCQGGLNTYIARNG